MAWENKPNPKYFIDLQIEGIKLTIEYDVLNSNTHPEYWDEVSDQNEILVRRIIHKEVDIKRVIRGGFMKALINQMVFEKHNQE